MSDLFYPGQVDWWRKQFILYNSDTFCTVQLYVIHKDFIFLMIFFGLSFSCSVTTLIRLSQKTNYKELS